MPRKTERMYSPHIVAKYAGCVVHTIYRHLEQDKFPNAKRMGVRKWFIPEQDVIDYLGYDPTEIEVELIK